VVKIRLQVQGEGAAGAARGGILRDIIRTDGVVRGLSQGISSQLLRASTYYTLKIGMYDVFKRTWFLEGVPGTPPLAFGAKLASGLAAGAVGAALSNPCDVVMVRMLADPHRPAAERRGYAHAWAALVRIPREEGAGAYLKGFLPNVGRATVVTASQLVTYDVVKPLLLAHTPLEDAAPAHFASALASGAVTGVISNPMDVIKTRIMNAVEGTYGAGAAGVARCVGATWRAEGFRGFYKGCATTIGRQCAYTLGMFLIMEKVRTVLADEEDRFR
jgi:hypothetical protein